MPENGAQATVDASSDDETTGNYPDGEIDRIKEKIDWEHNLERSPYENLKAFLEAAPDDIERGTVISFSFKYILALGKDQTTPRILDNMAEWDDQTGYTASEGGLEGSE